MPQRSHVEWSVSRSSLPTVKGTDPREQRAERLTAFRARLLTDALTTAQLAARRDEDDLAAMDHWVAARCREHALLAWRQPDGSAVIPAFQLSDAGEPRAELRPLLGRLLGAGIDTWTAWTWLTQPSSLLSGEVPERAAATVPERALRAATRFAAGAGA